MGHHHHHHHNPSDNILVALGLNFSFALIELAGGLYIGSVAILSDAVHDLGDSLALGLAWFLEKAARKAANQNYTFGYKRLSLLSALFTSGFLVVASVFVLVEAIPRLFQPQPVIVEGMFLLALLGIAVNGYAAWRVQRGGTMNERVVSWHLVEDTLGWFAVLLGSVVMFFVDLPIIDPILSVGFTLFILWRVFGTLKGTAKLFLQGIPEGIDLEAIRGAIHRLPGVVTTHDVHLWSLDGENHVMTLHLVVKDDLSLIDQGDVKETVRKLMAGYGKFHATVEIESSMDDCRGAYCVEPSL